MIIPQFFNGTLNDFSRLDTQSSGYLFQFFLKIPGYRAHEMHGLVLIGVLHDVSEEEIFKAGYQQLMDFWFFPMRRKERSEAGQKTVGLRLTVHSFYDI